MAHVDHAAGEKIDAERRMLVAELRGIERARDVEPARVADEALVAIDELLPADLQRERELPGISEHGAGLVHVERAVEFGQIVAGRGGIVALVAEGITGAAFQKKRERLPGVARARHDAQELVDVARVVLRACGKIPVGAGVGRAGAILALLAQTDVHADVPRFRGGIGGAQLQVEVAGERLGRRGRRVLRADGWRESERGEKQRDNKQPGLPGAAGGISLGLHQCVEVKRSTGPSQRATTSAG